jgi:hypothetical protein
MNNTATRRPQEHLNHERGPAKHLGVVVSDTVCELSRHSLVPGARHSKVSTISSTPTLTWALAIGRSLRTQRQVKLEPGLSRGPVRDGNP